MLVFLLTPWILLKIFTSSALPARWAISRDISSARVELADAKGWLVAHESGTYVRLADAGAATVHRASTTI